MDMPRLFTVEEANALLPRVRELVVQMQARRQEAEEARQEFEQLDASKARGNGYDMKREQLASRITDKMRAIRQSLEAIQEIGCQVKDIDMGLVDFPGLRNGEIVNLCWRLGEEKIEYWHTLNTGFTSRQPIDF
jgi:hypothetical protein